MRETFSNVIVEEVDEKGAAKRMLIVSGEEDKDEKEDIDARKLVAELNLMQ